jgi:catechol 2,3-dioxygenase-like lactoylglutathione lyase family enzyme
MEKLKAVIKRAKPYQEDKMNLPVRDLEAALPFYETILGFQVVSSKEVPHPLATLERDGLQIGLAENGGDPEQDGCFFEVDNVEQAFAELKANGLEKEISDFKIQRYGDVTWKVFFVVAPDGLCYCYGEQQSRPVKSI